VAGKMAFIFTGSFSAKAANSWIIVSWCLAAISALTFATAAFGFAAQLAPLATLAVKAAERLKKSRLCIKNS
jgi:hypothetical protein